MEDTGKDDEGLQSWPDTTLRWLLLSYAPMIPLLMNTWAIKIPVIDAELPIEKAVNAWFCAVVATSFIAAYHCDLLVRNARMIRTPVAIASARARLLELLNLRPRLVRYLPCGAPVVAGIVLASIRNRIGEFVFWPYMLSLAVLLVPTQQDMLNVVLQRRGPSGKSLSLPTYLMTLSMFGGANMGIMVWIVSLVGVSHGSRVANTIVYLYGFAMLSPLLAAIVLFPLVEQVGLKRGWESTDPAERIVLLWAWASMLPRRFACFAISCSRPANWWRELRRCLAWRLWYRGKGEDRARQLTGADPS